MQTTITQEISDLSVELMLQDGFKLPFIQWVRNGKSAKGERAKMWARYAKTADAIIDRIAPLAEEVA